jgi:sugar phosphate isomerase/epimerase
MTMQEFELGFYLTTSLKTLPWQLEVLLARNIKNIGTDGFEKWRDDEFVDKIAGYIKQADMHLHSFHAPFGLCFPDKKDLVQSLTDNYRIIDVAAAWGAKNIVWHFRWFRSYKGDMHFAETAIMENMTKSGIDAIVSTVIPETCAYAAKYGINVNLENMPLFSWSRDCREIIDFIKKQNQPNLGFIYDIGHAWCNNTPPAEPILQAGRLLNDTHFHDNTGIMDWDLTRTAVCRDISIYDLHLPVGLGTINWVSVIRALREIQYKKPVIFEGVNFKNHPERNSLKMYEKSVDITVANWRAFEILEDSLPKDMKD